MEPINFVPIKTLYNDMDRLWNATAKKHAFTCKGCKDNCCKSLFFHHTHIEKAFLIQGFTLLGKKKKETVITLAEAYIKNTFLPDSEIISRKIMCPVNENGLCLLYPYRPMICRLHGLPHQLARPGGLFLEGPGCESGEFDRKPEVRLDRTRFYQEMARIEMAHRKAHNKTDRIKESVAQMLLS